MATIKAGTYRFNDVLTAPSDGVYAQVNITLPTIEVEGESGNLSFSQIKCYNRDPDGALVVLYDAFIFYIGKIYEPYGFVGWNAFSIEYGMGSYYGQTITIPTDQEVSGEFYAWFTANVTHSTTTTRKNLALIGGTSYEISGGKTLVNGTAYSISGGKTLVGGTAYEIGFGTPIGDLAVGSSVYLKYMGTPYEFLIVHQGLPDATLYDASCDGTWLLMKNIFSLQKWDSTNNDYANSDIKSSLDSMYIMFDVYKSIKQVKIPYVKGTSPGGSVSSGANGLSSRIFLLSAKEVGSPASTALADGVCLDYFAGSAAVVEQKRIAYYNGSADYWWLRSASNYGARYSWLVDKEGLVSMTDVANSFGFRPAMILPSDAKIDENFNVIA